MCLYILRDYFLLVYLCVLIFIFLLKGCYDVINEEVIKERSCFYLFINDIFIEGLRVVLVMVSIFLYELFLMLLIIKFFIVLFKSNYIKFIKVVYDRYS